VREVKEEWCRETSEGKCGGGVEKRFDLQKVGVGADERRDEDRHEDVVAVVWTAAADGGRRT
jgi:hypothetical protein